MLIWTLFPRKLLLFGWGEEAAKEPDSPQLSNAFQWLDSQNKDIRT